MSDMLTLFTFFLLPQNSHKLKSFFNMRRNVVDPIFSTKTKTSIKIYTVMRLLEYFKKTFFTKIDSIINNNTQYIIMFL